MIQNLADHIDQLDLALDQLALKDRNFDRFAFMLIDNVAELILHQHAQDVNQESEFWKGTKKPKFDANLLSAARGQYFEPKIKLAKISSLITDQVAELLQFLHDFRNTAYHSGARHEGILHSLALFHFKITCSILEKYTPRYWGWGSGTEIPYRAVKYLGTSNAHDASKSFNKAWVRLSQVAASMGDTLLADLYSDMGQLIDQTDEQMKFLAENSPPPISRDEVVIQSQAWEVAFSEKGKAFAKLKGIPSKTVSKYVEWIGANYPFQIKADPIPSWKKRLASLKAEKNPYGALKKYCSFTKQTTDFRAKIYESAGHLESHIDNMFEASRGN